VQPRVAAAICLVVAGSIGIGAVADHRYKNVRSNRAELAEWFCEHRGTRCGGPSSAGIDASWNRRELDYEIAMSTVGALGLVFTGLSVAGAVRAARRD
jgi:hypothetical protein